MEKFDSPSVGTNTLLRALYTKTKYALEKITRVIYG